MENRTKAIQLALATAIISGLANFISKIAVDTIKPPLVFTTVKNAGVGLLIIAIVLLSRKWKKIFLLNKKEIFWLVTIGLIGGSLPFYLYFTGLSGTSAINAALINKTMFIWVALLAVPLLKERFSIPQLVAVSLLFLSNVMIGGFKNFNFSGGELLILIATVLWAIESIVAKKVLKTVDMDLVVLARMGLGSAVLIAASAVIYPTSLSRSFLMSSTQWLWMVLITAALFGYVMCWFRALKLAPASFVASILVSATLVTNVLSAVFITKVWTTLMVAQGVLVVIGVGLLLWQFRVVKSIQEPYLSKILTEPLQEQ